MWKWKIIDKLSEILLNMTHNYSRQSSVKEGLISLGTGIIFGATSALAGHPFDTIKTKMQVSKELLNEHSGYIKTV